MKVWKRNVVVAAIMLFVCAAVYLNWSYSQEIEDGSEAAGGKLLGDATLVGSSSDDPLLSGDDSDDADGTEKSEDTMAETQTGYFSSARLNRQQARDSALSLLQEAAADEAAGQAVIDEANAAIQTMADCTLAEAQIENLVTAKGYAECVCFIGETSVSVVVAAVEGGLTDTDTARITEIVKEETGLNASQITIIEAEP